MMDDNELLKLLDICYGFSIYSLYMRHYKNECTFIIRA